MAQIIPSITSLPVDSSAAPSVEDIQDRLPSICVDYLSHDWSEEDVWASWRSMTRHKHEIANGVRLENASWRTWQKQRNKLKTISPETLNWLKDSDVTWLYGPLHTANVEPVRPLKVATTDERLGIDRPTAVKAHKTKPILKHRTLSEMLTIPMPSSPILESSAAVDNDIEPFDSEGDRPPLLQTKSDTNIFRNRSGPVRRKSPPRGPIVSGKQSPQEGDAEASPGVAAASGKRHISFNTFVEQCVAVDDPSESRMTEESDDDILEMRSSASSGRSSRPSMSRNSSSGSGEHLTIAKIAPTMLKTPGGFHAGSLPQMVYAPPAEYLSPGQHPAASQFDFPSPSVDGKQRWVGDDDEEYGSVGFDYFGGPDLGGDDRQGGKQVQTHVGSSYGRPPTVGQPPIQPKWRTIQPGSVESSGSVSSSSSSTSLNQLTSPQQTKGILKVRPPGTIPPPEPSSPPSSYFNYNPSAATGIGGLRGAQYIDQPGPSGSPVNSPVLIEERGRTTSRERGRDRSLSRGTSSSTNSISPGAPSSPVGPTRRTYQPTASPSTSTQASVPGATQIPVAAPALDPVEENSPWEPMEVDYIPDRSSTPTPHSSPQITFRPLKDTSPASLPHTSTRTSFKQPPSSHSSAALSPPATQPHASPTTPTHELPRADPPTSVPSSSSGPKATIAHVGTNAQPTLARSGTTSAQHQTQHMAKQHPSTQGQEQLSYLSGSGQDQSQPLQGQGHGQGQAGQPMDDEDGSSIMGRAANIASTAKDLLGALWYGANEDPRARQGRTHRRGSSMG